MLKVDNIIPLWRSVIPNMVLELCPKLSHVSRILKCRTKNCEPRRCSKKVTKVSNKRVYFVRGLQRRSRASIKGRLFEGSIGLRGGSMLYFVRWEDYWGLLGGSPTLVNLGNDHEFISKEYISNGTRPFGETNNKAMRAYAQSGQYHTIVEIPWFLTSITRSLAFTCIRTFFLLVPFWLAIFVWSFRILQSFLGTKSWFGQALKRRSLAASWVYKNLEVYLLEETVGSSIIWF